MAWGRPSMALPVVVAATFALAITIAPLWSQAPSSDPLAFLEPAVTLTRDERARLARDEAIARSLPSQDGQIAVFAASRLAASPDALVPWTRAIADFKRSRFVLAIGRFSDPPVLSDLDGAVLDDRDLDELRRCEPGDCGLKLTAPEINGLAGAASGGGTQWRATLQRAFRQVMLGRVQTYREGGLAAVPAPADRDGARRFHEALAGLVERSPQIARIPALARWLQEYPRGGDDVESFFYWSKEFFGSGKAVIGITHVAIVRQALVSGGPPATIVAGKQIFATHYSQSSIGLTMALPGSAGEPSYLVYLNRSAIDVLNGLAGSLARPLMERRLARNAPGIVAGLRARLESGAPPATTSAPRVP
jgi:hypothetical protein